MPRPLKWSLPRLCFLRFSSLHWSHTTWNETHLSCNTKFCCYLFNNSELKHENGQTALHSEWLTSCVKFWGRTLPSMASPWHCKRNTHYWTLHVLKIWYLTHEPDICVHKVLYYWQGDQRIRLWHQGKRLSDLLYGPHTHYPMGSWAFSVEVNQL